MNYPINTPMQARAVLKALRAARGLSQAEAGRLMGVNQKRIARIEAAPGRTSVAQIAKLVALLGGRLAIDDGRTDAKQPKAPW
ncbi:MAG TPA: helix-turn-helix transcriptional regulator [Candidatus Limnocylindria bacterium]|jgi:HTH-type transcriptional regulator/antitoxin HipB|nr:helix-turn-helix transcriptional regulator [Candidatus Limnocylindria bacterium]